jgi:hypothetical protein
MADIAVPAAPTAMTTNIAEVKYRLGFAMSGCVAALTPLNFMFSS